MSVDLDEIDRLAKASKRWAADDLIPGFGGEGDSYIPDVAYDMDENVAAFIAAANPAVMLDLIRRVEEAEAIVRDLAKTDIGNDDSFCDLCKNSWSHKATCPYRRAVEASK